MLGYCYFIRDNILLNKAYESTYLDTNLNHTKDLKREVCQQIQVRKQAWQKFSLFWKDFNTNKKWQLIIYDVAIKNIFL